MSIFYKCGYEEGHCSTLPMGHPLPSLSLTQSVSVFQITLSYHSFLLSPSVFHTLGLSLLHHHSHRSSSSLSWIMHYNFAIGTEKYFIFIKKIIYCGDGAGVLKPIENVDEIRFFIPAEYG